MPDDGFKQCPFCKEHIRNEALKCRFCGEWVDQFSQPPGNSLRTPVLDEPIPTPLPLKSNGTLPVAWGTPSSSVMRKSEGTTRATILKVIGLGLMAACASLASNIFTRPHLSHGDLGFLIEAFFRMALGFGIGGWIVWEMVRWLRGRRCVSVKAGCIFLAVIFAYYVVGGFYEGKQPPQETNRQGTSNLVEFVSGVQEFSQQGGTGVFPSIKLTGTVEDTITQFWNDYHQELMQVIVRMNTEIEALQQQDVFEDSMLTNKASLETEIRKWTEGQQIIDKCSKAIPRMVETYRQRCRLLNVPDGRMRSTLRVFEESVQAHASQYETMFNLRQKKEMAELGFLQFMASVYGDYKRNEEQITFGSATNSLTYNELAKSIQDVAKEQETFEKRQRDLLDAAKAKMQKLGK